MSPPFFFIWTIMTSAVGAGIVLSCGGRINKDPSSYTGSLISYNRESQDTILLFAIDAWNVLACHLVREACRGFAPLPSIPFCAIIGPFLLCLRPVGYRADLSA
ncbi:hypothetical protein NITMOv2_0761 [Nitrospira moscoviensis]|uniref:Uncharacterized protein n=1 Tax=Nitrospira moscoviensis TaxID=42253 RepID=A0A0K2G9B2_NITMO|nr:hypothetical protein NITMOv2_0761 [Nitrospira moscoviensis]